MGSTGRWVVLLCALILVPACGSGGTNPAVLPDGMPTGILVTVQSTRTVRVDWTDTSSNEAGFAIQVRPSGLGAFVTLLEVNQGLETAVLGGLAPDTAYDIQVVAVNAKGASAAAPFLTITTLAPLWSPLPDAPPGRHSVQSAFHSGLRRMFLFGGIDGSPIGNDTLSYLDLTSLAPAEAIIIPTTPARPEIRFRASLIHDSRRNSLILFGGFSLVNLIPLNDIWEFNLTTQAWLDMTPPPSGTDPQPRSGHSAVYDPINGKMIIFAGFDDDASQQLNSLHRLNLPAAGPPAWDVLTVSGGLPIARDGHTAIYDPFGLRMVVFGGNDGGVTGGPFSNELWALPLAGGQTVAWTLLASSGDVPPPREFHAAVYDGINRQMVVFGGRQEPSTTADDRVWTLTLDGALFWRQVSPLIPTPNARFGSTAVFDPGDIAIPGSMRMVLFGGEPLGAPLDIDVWSLGL